jgi:UDP-N-acetylmuramate dehydrogenase
MEQLSNFTTLKVGGPAQKIVHAHTEDELVEFVKAADKAGEKVLILGGGSNLLISDAGFAGTVIRVESKGNALDYDACSGGMIEVSAGEDWDKFVEQTIEKGFADLESLSGIPGTVGGAPIQNIGAYGHEVSETIARVKAYDRKKGEVITFTNEQCHFSYRNSAFKEDAGRYVILNVTFQLRKGEMSLPITYAELAKYLSVSLGDRAPVMKVRKAVLELRGRKGMLINSTDVNSNSAGSFFVNPILTKDVADKLPTDAPRWPQSDGRVKTSAAWLMEHAGVSKGEKIAGAQISNKHVLALTNSGDATADDIIELAKMARAKVFEKFGIKLEAEVQLVGLDLN